MPYAGALDIFVCRLSTAFVLVVDYKDWCNVALTDPFRQPRAWKLDTPLAQLYEIPDFLTEDQCCFVMDSIDQLLVPSEVTFGDNSYRTSRTCHFPDVNPKLTKILDDYFSYVLGVSPNYAEPIQGQRYDPGQYFKSHNDWFDPDGPEYLENCCIGGQRTWTIMVYLNAVEKGGQTDFPLLGKRFTPVQGTAIAWNNLYMDGTPNPDVLHEALPVVQGNKYIITKWYREKPGRCIDG